MAASGLAPRPARAADVHDRPRQRTRLRRRDLRARRSASGRARVWVHIADVAPTCPRARGSTARRASARRASTRPAPSRRCCRTRSPATRARCGPGLDRAAVTVEMELDGAEVVKTRLLPLADPLGRAAGLRPRRSQSSPGASARRSRGRRRCRRRASVAAALERRRESAGALVLDSPEPEFEFDERGRRRRGQRAGRRPSPTG